MMRMPLRMMTPPTPRKENRRHSRAPRNADLSSRTAPGDAHQKVTLYRALSGFGFAVASPPARRRTFIEDVIRGMRVSTESFLARAAHLSKARTPNSAALKEVTAERRIEKKAPPALSPNAGSEKALKRYVPHQLATHALSLR